MTDSPISYPDALEITPLVKSPHVGLTVPGSKSITNRALILAALSDPLTGSEVRGALQCEDTEVMVASLRALGFRVHVDWPESLIGVRRGNHVQRIPADRAELFTANSGTSMRFLTALTGLGNGIYRLDGVARMRERPIEELLVGLRQLGVKATCERNNGFPPVVVEGSGFRAGTVRLRRCQQSVSKRAAYDGAACGR